MAFVGGSRPSGSLEQTDEIMIRLAAIDETNRSACLDLTLDPDQEHFVPSVASSLELASRYPEAQPLAILRDLEGVIGFAMIGIDSQTGLWKIYRLLIDRRCQGEGAGTIALALLLRLVHDRHQAEEILVSYQPENTVARGLYAKFGFFETITSPDKVTAKATLPSTLATQLTAPLATPLVR